MQRLSQELMESAAFDRGAIPVERPGYRAENIRGGIVHLGIGNFHRAHQAVYIDDLLAKTGEDWRITAVSLRNPDIRDALLPQNFLYTLCEQDAGREKLRIIAAVESVLVAPENPAAVIEALARESTFVVTITVTEKGYCLVPGGRDLDLTHPDIARDITGRGAPATLVGFLLAACRLRKARGLRGFSVLSCDNLPNNSALLKSCLLTAARLQDSRLAEWIEAHLGFCNTMVDCMVPATSSDIAGYIQARTGYRDSAGLLSEGFRQWVIEDNFVARRPDLAAVGVRLVADVAPYERMKLRLLNGSHSALAYAGILLGHTFIHEAVEDAQLRRFVRALMHREFIPTLGNLDGIDLPNYCETLLVRFANRALPYSCGQVASDGSQKLAQRMLQPAAERCAEGRTSPLIAVAIASWLAFLHRSLDKTAGYAIDDPGAGKLVAMLQRQQKQRDFPCDNHVLALLTHAGIVPGVLLNDGSFVREVAGALKEILVGRLRELLERALSSAH